MKRIGIIQITVDPSECAVPISAVPFFTQLDLGKAKMYRRFYGLEKVFWNPGRTWEQSLHASLAPMTASLHQLAGRGPILTLIARTILQQRPALSQPFWQILPGIATPVCTLSQGHCASGLIALETSRRLVEAGRYVGVLLLAGEKAFDPSIWITPNALMSEAGVAVLVSEINGVDESPAIIGTWSQHDGRFAIEPQNLNGSELRRYNVSYIDQWLTLLQSAFQGSALCAQDIDLWIPHNVNRIAVAELFARLGIASSRVCVEQFATEGHAFCADNFRTLKSLLDQKRLPQGTRIGLMAAGVGATAAVTFLEF